MTLSISRKPTDTTFIFRWPGNLSFSLFLILIWHKIYCYSPWANGALIVLRLKGLQDMIGVSVVHPTWEKTSDDPSDTHCGWVFKRLVVYVVADK